MTGSKDDTSGSFFADDRQFGGRRGSQTDVHHTIAHAAQGGTDEHIHHLAADACIATDDECLVIGQRCLALGSVRSTETNDINGVQSLAHATAYTGCSGGTGREEHHQAELHA